MPDLDEKDAVVVGGAYKESDDFVPDPTSQYGTVDTSGTAGTAHARIEEVSPIFEVARKQDLITAGRALDPDDDGVPESAVSLPVGQPLTVVDHDKIREDIRTKAKAASKEPVEVGGPTLAQKEAAETGGEAKADAKSQQKKAARDSQ